MKTLNSSCLIDNEIFTNLKDLDLKTKVSQDQIFHSKLTYFHGKLEEVSFYLSYFRKKMHKKGKDDFYNNDENGDRILSLSSGLAEDRRLSVTVSIIKTIQWIESNINNFIPDNKSVNLHILWIKCIQEERDENGIINKTIINLSIYENLLNYFVALEKYFKSILQQKGK